MSTAPKGSMNKGKGQFQGTISTMPDPDGELGAESNLGCFVSLPAGVVWPTGGVESEARLGHVEAALNDRGCRGVEGTEAAVPRSRRIINRHEVPLRKLGQFKIGLHEAGGERRAPG